MTSQRIQWQDTAKGLGIVLVAFGHVERGLVLSGILTSPVWGDIDFALYTFHMPLFMFLAGLNVPRSLRVGTVPFLRKKAGALLVPYFAWTVIQSVVMATLGSMANNPKTLEPLLYVLWEPVSPFWFLYALFVFMVLVAILPRRLLIGLAVIAFLAAEPFGVDTLVHQLLHFLLFFVAGVVVGGAERGFRLSPLVVLGSLATWALGVGIALNAGFENYNSVLMLPVAVAGSIAVIAAAQITERAVWLVRLGQMSLAIYVMHIMAGAGTRIVFDKILHVPHIPALYLLVCTAASVIGPVIAYLILERLNLLHLVGLGSRKRPRTASLEDAGEPA